VRIVCSTNKKCPEKYLGIFYFAGWDMEDSKDEKSWGRDPTFGGRTVSAKE
jgi:hypothetical protein